MSKIWYCKIGEVDALPEVGGADLPMRFAVEKAYKELTGERARFLFSGWGATLTESERAVVENRLPRHSYSLCGVCYQISDSSEWNGYNWDDEHEHIIKVDGDPTFFECPQCHYHHIDDDSDPGVWEGSFDQMLFEVKCLINDE